MIPEEILDAAIAWAQKSGSKVKCLGSVFRCLPYTPQWDALRILAICVSVEEHAARESRNCIPSWQAGLIHCVCTPFTIEPEWLTTTALALAEGIYRDRAWDRMPFLANALEDEGATGPVVEHCRCGVHALGCGVVDALTGRL